MSPFDAQLSLIEKNFREVFPSSTVALDLKYATPDNFMKENVYRGFHRCFLAPAAFDRFIRTCARLKSRHPDLQFLIWDTLRPRSVQKKFFDRLAGTPYQNYVASPFPGSLHNFGMAMDLTLQTRDGIQLDMGTGFDDFRDLAQPKLEERFLKTGELSRKQHRNRLLLRALMEEQGFQVLEHEWWHFNALPKDQVHGKFVAIE